MEIYPIATSPKVTKAYLLVSVLVSAFSPSICGGFGTTPTGGSTTSFATDTRSLETPLLTIPGRLVGGKIDIQLGEIEFENLGREARLQGALGAG